MTIHIKFFANVKKSMGKDEITLNLAPSKHYSIRDILKEIERSENKELFHLSSEAQGVPIGSVRIVLNGKIIHSFGELETTVHDGDRIANFPLLAGG